jgi:hypothetical protein
MSLQRQGPASTPFLSNQRRGWRACARHDEETTVNVTPVGVRPCEALSYHTLLWTAPAFVTLFKTKPLLLKYAKPKHGYNVLGI